MPQIRYSTDNGQTWVEHQIAQARYDVVGTKTVRAKFASSHPFLLVCDDESVVRVQHGKHDDAGVCDLSVVGPYFVLEIFPHGREAAAPPDRGIVGNPGGGGCGCGS